MKDLPKHLGGHGNRTHIDEGALRFLHIAFKATTMLDVGCGVGGMIHAANKKGITALGIDGDFTVIHDVPVLLHDFTTGPAKLFEIYDVAWSVEFLEHVEEQFLPNIFEAFTDCRFVFCTANPIKGNGHHHVNCQPLTYWIKKFEDNDFTYLEKETIHVRNWSTMKRDFVRKTGMVFKNNRYEDSNMS